MSIRLGNNPVVKLSIGAQIISRVYVKSNIVYSGEWAPFELFANNEPGVWYDPSDLSTLFQDSAGTTPVMAVEQPVGLILDKSKGLVLGPELVTNGDFSNGTTGWVQQGTSTRTVVDNVFRITTPVTNGNSGAKQLITGLTAGKTYRVSCQIRSVSAVAGQVGTIRWANGNVTSGYSILANVAVSPSFIDVSGYITPSGTTVSLFLINGGTDTIQSTFDYDNISVRELSGNHAYQTTTTSRPVLSARVNLLTKTEQFDDAVWLKANAGSGVIPTVSANAGLSPIGTQTANLITINRSTTTGASFLTQRLTDNGVQKSRALYVKAFEVSDIGKVIDTWTYDSAVANRFAITLTADWQKVILPDVTLPAGTNRELISFGYLDNGSLSPNTGQIRFYAWGSSIVPSNQSSLPYQRVNTATDYDTAGFPHYLRFDGVDDFLVTPTITPNTDKVQVFAGVRKLSDATLYQVLLESSPAYSNNNGAFILSTSWNAGQYATGSRGTSYTNCITSPLSAPRTNVATMVSSIADDTLLLRINGTQAASSTADQGTGNYLAYPLYIGRRAGTSLPFNGHLYSLIVRFGSNLPIATIEQAEAWINGKTGAY